MCWKPGSVSLQRSRQERRQLRRWAHSTGLWRLPATRWAPASPRGRGKMGRETPRHGCCQAPPLLPQPPCGASSANRAPSHIPATSVCRVARLTPSGCPSLPVPMGSWPQFSGHGRISVHFYHSLKGSRFRRPPGQLRMKGLYAPWRSSHSPTPFSCALVPRWGMILIVEFQWTFDVRQCP
jgi:hypothetical protein